MVLRAFRVPVKCPCGWRGTRAYGNRTETSCPSCDGYVLVGTYVKRGDDFVRAWRSTAPTTEETNR